jgi:hypothetical protein
MRTLASLAALCAVPLAAAAQGVDLTGAGATFPYPIYSKWFADYAATAKVKINYTSDRFRRRNSPALGGHRRFRHDGFADDRR